ncbi:MAG: acyl-CoA thioesterase/bile acid-CoA:amino acid N-acyltransferase family protein [Actinomycetes bacterium]
MSTVERPAAAEEVGEKSGGAGSMALGFFAGFAPWIVYWILSGSTSFETAVTIAFVLALLSNVLTYLRSKSFASLKVLEIGTAVAFAVLAIVGLLAGQEFVARWIQALGNGALMLIMFVSVMINKPFTLQYARDAVPREMWDKPGFLAVNKFMTWMWVAAMGFMTVCSLVPPIVQGNEASRDGEAPLSIIFYWVLPYVALGLAILFTVRFPEWFGAEFDDVEPVAGERQQPIPVQNADDQPSLAGASLAVPPDPTLLDEPLPITVSGLNPGARVELTTTTVDMMGNLWRAHAAFVSDESGTVDTTTAPPVDGDYTGADPGALIWGMRFATPGATPALFIPTTGPTGFSVAATTDGATLTATAVRRTLPPGVAVQDISEDGVVGRLLVPDGPGPFPAVVLFGGSEGGIDSHFSNAAVLASHGYLALTAGYFRAEGLPSSLVQIPLESLARPVTWLSAHSLAAPGGVAVVGISRGSEGVLSMASHIAGLPVAAVVAIAPSQVSWTAMGDDGTIAGVPSWTVDGEPVPHLDIDDMVLANQAVRDALRHRGKSDPLHPHVLHLTESYNAALGSAQAAAAAIPVEQIQAPILCLSGTDDQVWPSSRMYAAIEARRSAAGKAGDDGRIDYQDAGHFIRLGIMPTGVSDAIGIAFGGTREGLAIAQQDACTRVLEFLGKNLPHAPH